jgi:hypothetical protein
LTPSRREIRHLLSTNRIILLSTIGLVFHSRTSLPCAPWPKRDRFTLNRPLLNLSNPIYPTPLFSTTPVTLQQPPGSDLFSLIFFHYLSLPSFAPGRHPFPVNIPAFHWHVGSFGTGLIPRPGDLLSTRDVTTRRAPVSKCLHRATIILLSSSLGSYHNVLFALGASQSWDEAPFPCAGQTVADLSSSRFLHPMA